MVGDAPVALRDPILDLSTGANPLLGADGALGVQRGKLIELGTVGCHRLDVLGLVRSHPLVVDAEVVEGGEDGLDDEWLDEVLGNRDLAAAAMLLRSAAILRPALPRPG